MERRKREEWRWRWKVVDLSERDGKDGYYGTRCALIRGAGTGCALSREVARKFCEDRKRLIYKYICRKMIYFAIKTA